LGRFTYLAFGFIVIAVYKFYLTQLLEMRWRAWMTNHYLRSKWMSHQAFYRLELARSRHLHAPRGQPGQPRPAYPEDIDQFTTFTISLSIGLLNSVVTLVSFVELCGRSQAPLLSHRRAAILHTRLHGLDGGAVLRCR